MSETITPRELAAVLPTLIEMREPVCIFGAPGIGKSQIVQQAAAKMGPDAYFYDLRAVLLDPVDLRGLPNINAKDGLCHWLPPASLPQPNESGLLFLDELPQAPPAMQSALLQLTLDRAIGDYVLPDGVAIVAAGNRPEDRTGASRLITALSSRFINFTLEPDFESWLDHVNGTGEVGPDVQSFLRWKPSAFCINDPTKPSSPNPRSWVKAAKVLGRLGNVGRSALDATLRGILGTTAVELLAFLDLRHTLPTAEEMIRDPKNITLPSRLDASWAATVTLLGYFDRSDVTIGATEVDAFFTLLERFPVEPAVVCYADSQRVKHGQKIVQGVFKSEAGKRFSGKHRDLFKGLCQ